MNSSSSSDPQVVSNDLEIAFGIVMTFLAIPSFVVAINHWRDRRRERGQGGELQAVDHESTAGSTEVEESMLVQSDVDYRVLSVGL